ncbi:PREDICTED: uncharacterized protein MAL13P1.304-like [Atta cephalotes]|uniref:Uncharacterized protein n=1 Tax=Atta cephalotes TaxID=12957 RepID=A0A158N9Z9_ATTCE|nr:PREDICTED: uncharacterized protein MAL13P1.304-like [Atta cephalotes]
MPGIHIRTLSQFNWLEKESLLTIPGAYWLCHKKNIYKFIFRYHRTVKNIIQFSYGRELLKIIRKIIKCHPTQGQQFGTQHLLVTYNCTSWTRQDKMFAIMKFQQRTNAAAFSHAFVLTIKTFPLLEHSLFDLKYPIVKEADAGTTFKDLNISLDTEEKIISNMISITDKESPMKDTTCHTKEIHAKYIIKNMTLSKALETKINSFQDDTMESASLRENLDKRIKNATITAQMHFIDKHNKEFHNDVQENKYINCNTEEYEKNIEQYSIDCVQEQSLKTNETNEIEKTQKMNEEVKTESALIQKQKQTQDIQKYTISSSLKSPLTGMIIGSNNECSLNKFNFDEKSIQKDDICTINNKDNLNNNKKTISENINSNNVLHQNFIEKQIKNSKFRNLIIDQPMQKIEIKNIDKDCVPKMIEENDKSIYINQDHNETNLEFQENNRQCKTSMDIDKQSENHMHSKSYKTRKQKSRDSEKKTVPDKVLRSSNITDLVMEGLMFTIRQDQDSVAVIEQKTKLEIDEVLENSEKVETKAGEKCLLNSSLLRLENLVTMIDSPRSKDEEHKNHHTIGNNANLSPFNAFPNDIYNDVYNVNINEVDTGMNESNVSNYDKHNTMKHLNLYQSRWQHQCVSSKISNSCSASEISIKNREQLMEWQGSDDEQNKNYKNNIKIRKQEHYFWDNIPEISLSKKINAGLQNTASLINRNIEEIDKYDKSMEEQYSSSPSNYLLNSSKMSTVSVISENSNSIELSHREANAPRIVSNESITIEQMSPALQNVLRHRCRARKSSTTSNGMFQQNEQKMQSMALMEDTISETDNLKDKCTDSNIVNITINSKKINNNEKSCAINKNVSEMNRNTHVKNSKRKNRTRRTLRSSSSKHDSPRKLQDITEEFYYDLMHVHNEDNAIRNRCLKQKQKSLNNLNGIKSGKVRIQMLKFIQDITEGVRVVVKRLNIDNKSNLLEKNSNLI